MSYREEIGIEEWDVRDKVSNHEVFLVKQVTSNK